MDINYNQAIDDLKFIINATIDKVSFPFYFRLLFKICSFNEDNNYNHLNCDKYDLIRIIIDKFINHKITLDINNDAIITENKVAFLIYIYNFIVIEKEEIDHELENILFLFLNHLKDINVFNSKYVFDVHLEKDDLGDEKKYEKKFILEMVSDIYFHFYETKEYDLVYQFLIKGIFDNSKLVDILKIDNQIF